MLAGIVDGSPLYICLSSYITYAINEKTGSFLMIQFLAQLWSDHPTFLFELIFISLLFFKTIKAL